MALLDLCRRSVVVFLCFAFSTLIISCGSGGSSYHSTTPPPPTLSISLSPATLTVYDNTTFAIAVTAVTSQSGATPTVTLGQLPTGLTSTTAFPLSIPPGGAQVTFVADKTLPAGTYDIAVNGTAGSAVASASLEASVQAGTPPDFYLIDRNLSSLAVPVGSSATIQFSSYTNDNLPADYDVAMAISGLPPGVTAAISPQILIPGQSVTVTLSAASTAPISQNSIVVLTGTALAPVPQANVSFLASVTVSGAGAPVNRTDYVSTEGSPNSAVYDSSHHYIFASNPSWNRVDVISTTTHQIIRSVPVRGPRGVDITQDDSHVWVTTASQQVYSINTTTLAATHYMLPNYAPTTGLASSAWQGQQVFALADGTLFLLMSSSYAVIWDPAANAITGVAPPTGSQWPAMWEDTMRTGNAKRVYSVGEDSAGESFYYDVVAKTVSPAVKLGGYALAAAVNFDGSQVAVYDANGLNLYDGNFNLIAPLPGGGDLGGGSFSGGLVFSPDNTTLYEESMPVDTPLIYTIDASTRSVRGIAPAMPMIPVFTELSPSFYIPIPFAVDESGMLLCLQDWGIAFEDSTFFENLTPLQPGTPTFMQHMSPYAGPLAGGTQSSGFGNAFSSAPNVWYGSSQGSASVNSSQTLTITSPPASSSGPVNLKMLFADGTEVYDPLFFNYGSDPQYAFLSGASPDGGVPGVIAGFGVPYDGSGGSLMVGASTAQITSQPAQYPPFTGTPFPSTFLKFTVPAGQPGWADITVTTPNGTGVLSKGLFYAQSVKDYSSSDSFTAVLLDRKRQQLYLSAGDHIDVFSLTSNQFVSSLTPPSQGSKKQFAGLALTPDGSLLLAANLADGSLAVINPDNALTDYAIPVAAVSTGISGCSVGPLYVAASINQQAYVVTGSLPNGNACGPGGLVYQVNLATSSVTTQPNGFCGGGNVMASQDGSTVAFGENPAGYGEFCTYDATQNVYYRGGDYRASAAISGDGNVASSQWVLTDGSANVVGSVAQPPIYYPTSASAVAISGFTNTLLEPQINDSGSLYYIAAPNYVDIVDVQHGLLRMRFSLNETIVNTAAPIAIDSGGRHTYLITSQGLTIVDLGSAPLSIGHLSPELAASGTQITIRGCGFNTGITATVGGQPASINIVDENTLELTMPVLQSGPQDIVLTNADGYSYTLENGVTMP